MFRFPLFLIFPFFFLSGFAKVKKPRPNVLFILVDDMGARDLSNEGSTFYESPNIDRIANEGMKFTRGYATCQVRENIPPIMGLPLGLVTGLENRGVEPTVRTVISPRNTSGTCGLLKSHWPKP